jgi:hypothetical protein
MNNRERLQLNRVKIRIIRYLRGNQFAILGKNEAMKVLLRKANGEKISYSVAIG